MGAREQASLYQELGPTPGKKKKNAAKQLSSGGGGGGGGGATEDSGGVYQALVEPNRDAPSAYAVRESVFEVTSLYSLCLSQTIHTPVQPGRSASNPASPTGGGDPTYMGLRPDTRQPEEGGTYARPGRK